MKSIKNTFIISITLISALFSSLQVIAMEPASKINPYLEPWMKRQLRDSIINFEHKFNTLYDPKNPLQPGETREQKNYQAALMSAQLNAYKTIYYGNKPYTHREMLDLVDEYIERTRQSFGIE